MYFFNVLSFSYFSINSEVNRTAARPSKYFRAPVGFGSKTSHITQLLNVSLNKVLMHMY